MFCLECNSIECIKTNEIVNTFLLVGDNLLPEIHSKQLGFTYRACDSFTKSKERIEKFIQTENTDFLYRNKLDKACFLYDTAYVKSIDLAKRTQSEFNGAYSGNNLHVKKEWVIRNKPS